MKYLLLIYSSREAWEALPEHERERMRTDHLALNDELAATGEWIGGEALADPEQTTRVQLSGGAVLSSDGPFAEAKEHLAGYDLVDCDSLERAVEIAGRIPSLALAGVEIRPVMDLLAPEP